MIRLPFSCFVYCFFISSRVGWSTDVASVGRIIPKLMKGPHYFNQQENAERKKIRIFSQISAL